MQLRSVIPLRPVAATEERPATPLWALHFPAQNDWYAAPTEMAARELADAWNAFVARTTTLDTPHQRSLRAVARAWPHGADAHAKCLPEWSTVVWDFTPPKALLS